MFLFSLGSVTIILKSELISLAATDDINDGLDNDNIEVSFLRKNMTRRGNKTVLNHCKQIKICHNYTTYKVVNVNSISFNSEIKNN